VNKKIANVLPELLSTTNELFIIISHVFGLNMHYVKSLEKKIEKRKRKRIVLEICGIYPQVSELLNMINALQKKGFKVVLSSDYPYPDFSGEMFLEYINTVRNILPASVWKKITFLNPKELLF